MSMQLHTGKILISIGIVTVSLFFPAFVSNGKNADSSFPDYAMYTKANEAELYYLYFPEDNSGPLSSGLLDEIRYDSDPSDLSNARIARTYKLSQDGELLFFPDALDYSCFSLFYRNINDPIEKAVKIDSDIYSYLVSEDASVITYRKDNALCQYNRKTGKRQTIAQNVGFYYVSDDKNTILYSDNGNVFYYTPSNGRREKVDIHIYDMNSASKDLSTIYYIGSDSYYPLCKKERGKENVRIDSHIWEVIKAYDSGEIYYVTVDSVTFPLLNYVYDDKKEADAVVTKPVPPDRNSSDYETEYRIYRKAFREYCAKLKRDEIREYLKEAKSTQWGFSHYALYYYDGKETTLISNSFTDSSFSFAADEPVITFNQYNLLDDAGVDLSEIENTDKVIRTVCESICSVDRYIAFGASVVPLDQEGAADIECRLSSDGKILYYLEKTPKDNDYGNLYQMNISSPEKLGAPKLYDTNVFCNNLYYNDNLFYVGDNLLYFKNYKDDNGELYVNRSKIDDDVNRIITDHSSFFLQR